MIQQKRILLIFLTIILWCTTPDAYAWDASGHRIIAQIALDNLRPQVKKTIEKYNHSLNVVYRPSDIVWAAAWPDQLSYIHEVGAYKHWHYIDLPYKIGHTKIYPTSRYNVVWAINQSEKVLQSSHSNNFEKGMFLRFLIHFIGDIHQPLHCVTRYTHVEPKGDAGGNRYTLHYGRYKNLHQLWDGGIGLFREYSYRYPLNHEAIIRAAAKLQKQFPRSHYNKRLSVVDPMAWAKESYELAISDVYTMNGRKRPTQLYIKGAQHVVAEQVTLAGYRLATVLNHIIV